MLALAKELVAHLPPGVTSEGVALHDLEAALERSWTRAVAEWAPIALERSTFIAALARCMQPGDDLLLQIRCLSTSELYLVTACVNGDAEAWRVLESRYLSSIERRLARSRSGSAASDAYDRLRQQLLTPAGEQLPLLASYAGRSRLATWLFAVTKRQGMDTLRSARRFVELRGEDSTGVDERASERDPEIEFLGKHFESELKAAVRPALKRA